MSLFSETMQDASRVVNEALGVPCLYRNPDGKVLCKTASITINKNIVMNDSYGMLAGYRVEASILKSDVTSTSVGDNFTDDDGDEWRVNLMTKETTSKWYVDISRI